MTWTQPMCAQCFTERHPYEPVRLTDPEPETCCVCGVRTTEGIYVCVDPTTVPYPRHAADDDY